MPCSHWNAPLLCGLSVKYICSARLCMLMYSHGCLRSKVPLVTVWFTDTLQRHTLEKPLSTPLKRLLQKCHVCWKNGSLWVHMAAATSSYTVVGQASVKLQQQADCWWLGSTGQSSAEWVCGMLIHIVIRRASAWQRVGDIRGLGVCLCVAEAAQIREVLRYCRLGPSSSLVCF